MIAHELHRLAREHFGGVLAVLEDFRAVAPQVVIVRHARLAPVVAVRVIVDAARVETEEAVEAVRVGVGLRRLAQVPLAEKSGGIARRLQHLRDGLLRRRPAAARCPALRREWDTGPSAATARDGAQTGAAAYQLVKRTPPAASASMFGVFRSVAPHAPRSWQPRSSARKRTTLGRAGAAYSAPAALPRPLRPASPCAISFDHSGFENAIPAKLTTLRSSMFHCS